MSASPDDLPMRLPLSGMHLVEASAGTGKTFTLTAWVLRLLLETGVPLRNILVVTFTRAATAELRERVRRRLRIAERALAGERDDIAEAVQTRTLIDHARQTGIDDATLRVRLQAALLQLDDASISTIHGFCQRALREFGFLAGVLGDAAVVDDVSVPWQQVAADLWRNASLGDAESFRRMDTLWRTPEALARDLPKLCDPARVLLPKADEQEDATWLHELRADAASRFAQALDARRQRSQDQLIERVWQASMQSRFAAAVGQRWPLMLVDEFQDTDPRQWQIFRNIFDARLRDDAVDANDTAWPRGLFLIGDPKQAIYRFRSGDLPTYLAARDEARKHGKESTLEVNFRSTPAVLAGIEALFRSSDAPFVDAGIAFIPVRAAEHHRDAALTVDGVAEPGVTMHWLPLDKPNSSARSKQLAVETTVNEIVRLLSGARIACKDHGGGSSERELRAGDIAVLTRTNKQSETVRDALILAGVPAVVLGGRSVFESEAATELQRLLAACVAPADDGRLRAALATRICGWSASRIAALDVDTDALQREQSRIEQAHLLWQQRGPLPALLPFLSAAAPRLLREHQGTRLLTDALHLAELLQAESPRQHGSHGLLRWLERHCSDGADDNGITADEKILRMESDAQSVQVMTLHKSKGLEFPVVFLPFTAFGGGGSGGGTLKHVFARDGNAGDATRPPAHYFHVDKDDIKLQSPEHKRLLEEEEEAERAESMRLYYVGMTRARHALHLIEGGSRTQDFNASPLKWLLIGAQKAGSKKKEGEIPTTTLLAEARATLQRIADSQPIALHVRDIPETLPHRTLASAERTPAVPAARIAAQVLPRGGGQYSYSGLRGQHQTRESLPARGADDERTASDDASSPLAGSEFGNAVHAVLEAADFAAWDGAQSAPTSANESIQRALAGHALPQTPEACAQVGALVTRALNVRLPGIDTLAKLPASRRIAELEFHFRLAPTRLPALHALLERHGYPRAVPLSRSGSIEGLMHGYIDLVYRDDNGAHHVLDYKTNRLTGYSPAECRQAIAASDYDLQYLIYLVALQRWLRVRLGSNYDPSRHLGGAVYLFLRGIDPHASEDASAGVHADRPPQALIDALDALFDGASP